MIFLLLWEREGKGRARGRGEGGGREESRSYGLLEVLVFG